MSRNRERGESLVELLISVAILGIAVVAIVAGMATAITASDANRKQGTVEAQLRNFAEAVTAATYVDCATTATYTSPPGFSLPSGYSSSVTSIQYFDFDGENVPTLTGTCPTPDEGVQVIRVQIRSGDDRAQKTLTFAKRRL